VALGVTLALAVSGIAAATADENDAKVVGKVAPAKLDKKKFKPINLTLGVENSSDWITGIQANPASELIRISKNVKINLGKRPRCNADLSNGTPPAAARKACPKKSFLGSGRAEVMGPGIAPQCGADLFNPPCVIAEPVVSVFNGPGKNQVRLHTYDPNLGVASPVVQGRIVPAGKKGYGKALRVANAPETGPLLITKFNATLKKSTGVATARCKPKKIKFERTVTYADDTRETVTKTQNCKVKKKAKKKKKKRR
jgi:hypothetical protein